MTDPTTVAPAVTPLPRRPRPIFLVIGLAVAVVLAVFLFTSAGTNKKSGPPRRGGPVPSFSAARLNGSGTVGVPADGGGGGTPAVLLFFGKWCQQCHTELPPLAAAVRRQDAAGGPLATVRVLGVDSEDTTSAGQDFIKATGVGFPVAHDPDITITSGDFYFEGDPNAVFIKADGTISAVVHGGMSAAQFTAQEKKLIPSGS
jgi:peroxiredoxin